MPATAAAPIAAVAAIAAPAMQKWFHVRTECQSMPSSKPKYFDRAADFRAWLQENASSAGELLVGFRKVGSGLPSMTWPESVDEALCFGWIDGVRKRIDDVAYQIRFTPRKADSIWSAVNIAKFEKLRADGRMTPQGAAAFGRRSTARSVVYSYEQAQGAQLDADEIKAFRRQRAAWLWFEQAPPSYRKTVLHWITSARKPQTRAARLAKLVAACATGARLR